MFNFNIQRFAAGSESTWTSDGEWIFADGYWGYVVAVSELWDDENVGYASVQDGGFAYYFTGVDSATGANSETVTLTLSGNVSGVTVYNGAQLGQGADRTALTVIIGGTTYAVNSSGKLYIPINLPEFGLMTKADKLKLDGIDTSTLLTKTEASSTYVTKALAITSGEMTANGFVLKNALGNGVVTIPAQA